MYNSWCSQQTPDSGLRKKTDAPTEDDRDENEADEEDDEDEDDGQIEETQEKEKELGGSENAHKPTKSDLEAETVSFVDLVARADRFISFAIFLLKSCHE